MKFSPDLLKATDCCQHRSFITNRYNGARIAVDCGQCDYCIHKCAQKASMRVKTAGSAFKYRSEERRVGKECLRLCRSRWSPYH